MNERWKLNSEVIRTWLDKEGRKQTWLATQLGVSGSTVDKMLNDAHVPKARTLKRLAAIVGCHEQTLLVPKNEAMAG